MLQGEHSAILSTFIKLPFIIKIFEWPFYTGFSAYQMEAQNFQQIRLRENRTFSIFSIFDPNPQSLYYHINVYLTKKYRVFSYFKRYPSSAFLGSLISYPHHLSSNQTNKETKYIVTHKAPPTICSRRKFQILLLFKNNK